MTSNAVTDPVAVGSDESGLTHLHSAESGADRAGEQPRFADWLGPVGR